MNCTLRAVCAVAILAHAQGPPQFRSESAAVSVDVTVESGGAPVTGLSATNFQLFDKGVPQTIRAIAASEVPVDVSLLLDTSGSMRPTMERLSAERSSIAALLGKSDSFALFEFGTRLHEVNVPTMPEAPMQTAGATALYDAITTAVIQLTDRERRHLLVVVTDGGDNVSVVDPETLMAVAERGQATVEVILIGDTRPSARTTALLHQYDVRLDLLKRVAQTTGGNVFNHSSDRDVMRALQLVLDRFRRGYVLYYTPEGVAQSGWHDIDVRIVGRHEKMTVHARRGYSRTS
jgi:Ca-activated chloride channel family protein